MKPSYAQASTWVFDLDGTLLDTLTDLSVSVNHALRLHGLPPRSVQDVRRFLGNGIRRLMEQSVPRQTSPELFEEVFSSFRTHYMEHCLDQTRPYEGVMPLLQSLSDRGLRLAIVSNKLQPAVTELHQRFFSSVIPVAIGESAEVRRKPWPDAVFAALRRLGSQPSEAVYVGDSEVDLETARRSGLPCVSVLWGFRDRRDLVEAGATCLVETPADILSLLS